MGHDRPVFNGFLDVYTERLKNLGYRVETEDISTIGNNAPVYYIIFAVANDQAYQIVIKAINFVRGEKQKWTGSISAKRDKIKGAGVGKGLDNWMN